MFLGSRLDKKLIEIKNSHGCAIDWYEYFVVEFGSGAQIELFELLNRIVAGTCTYRSTVEIN